MQIRSQGRRAAAALEMAILLPMLIVLFVAGADVCRGFSYASAVSNCARAGAVYASDGDPDVRRLSPYYNADLNTAIQNAALADWPVEFGGGPSVVSVSVGGASPSVDVTVTYFFEPAISYLGLPASIAITRTVRVHVTPATPNYN